MKNLICAILAATFFAAIADEPAATAPAPQAKTTETPPFDLKKKPQTEEEKAARKAYIEERFNKHTGGRLIVPGSLKGRFVYVNCQKRAPAKWLEDNAAVFHKSTKTASGSLKSWIGFKGLCKKGMILLMVLIAHRLDLALGMNYIREAVIIGFTTNEAISIVENAGLMGIPLPPVLRRAIDVLTEKSNTEMK